MDNRRKLEAKDEAEKPRPVISALAVRMNEEKFGEFQACVEKLKAEFEDGNIRGIDADELAAFRQILDNLGSITSANAALADKQKTYALNIENLITCLTSFRLQFHTMKSSGTVSDNVVQLEIIDIDKKCFREHLTRLSAATRYYLRHEERKKQRLKYFPVATIASIILLCIPIILVVCGVFASPFVLLGLIPLAGFLAMTQFGVISNFYSSTMDKLTKPIYHPVKDAVSDLIKKVTENISRNQSQLTAAKRDQLNERKDKKIQEDIKAKRDRFFGLNNSDITLSPCYQDLLKKQKVKLTMLQNDLHWANQELETIQTAFQLTEELIQNGNEEAVKDYEKRLLAAASTDEVKKDIKMLGDNRIKQAIALRLCIKKVEALKASIERHESKEYVKNRYDKYVNKRYPESAIAEVSLRNTTWNMYYRHEYDYGYRRDEFVLNPIEVKQPVYHGEVLTFFNVDKQNRIRSANSKKIRNLMLSVHEAAEKEVLEERKKRCMN